MALREIDADSSEESGFLLNEKHTVDSWEDSQHPRSKTPWILTALLAAVAIASIITNVWQWLHCQNVFTTDLPDARKAIQYEKRTYTGALVYEPDTKQAVRMKDAPAEYFGPPGNEIDAAWDALLKGEFIYMTEEEAEPFKPELRTMPPKHVYIFEPDVFHSLHCLNALRMEVSKVLYPNMTDYEPHDHHLGNIKLPRGWDVAHLEHCMDRLRQVLMCHGDLTPSPLYRWDGFNLAFGRTGEHTCRKWEPIREWMDERKRRDDAWWGDKDAGRFGE